MSVLIIAEHNNNKVDSHTANLIAAGLKFSTDLVLLVAGFKCSSVANQLQVFAGVKKIILVDNQSYEHFVAENISELVTKLCLELNFKVILAPASTFGKNILPRIAAKLNVAQISDVTKILDENTYEHPIYAGNAIETVKSLDPIKILTIRSTNFDSLKETQQPCEIETLSANELVNQSTIPPTNFISQESHATNRPDLSSAKIIVAGGRGLQTAEKFKLIDELAEVLGAAVGASRAAVDAGFVPNDYQIGQTGKIVAPLLYFAIGISGAIQHVAGMKDAKVIVAINKDEEAPIFQIANYGIVGDLFVLIPELIQELKKTTT